MRSSRRLSPVAFWLTTAIGRIPRSARTCLRTASRLSRRHAATGRRPSTRRRKRSFSRNGAAESRGASDCSTNSSTQIEPSVVARSTIVHGAGRRSFRTTPRGTSTKRLAVRLRYSLRCARRPETGATHVDFSKIYSTPQLPKSQGNRANSQIIPPEKDRSALDSQTHLWYI